MELPIDHFRLLGVSSSAGAEEVLRIFQLRLDRIPDHGFTHEALAQRAELLRLSADLLTDKSLRQEYESALSLGASGLELSSNREVAGLILLWEADLSFEAFNLARKSLQPPQTPALGSSREADLALIAALSCRDAALKEQDQRHYQFAAELLQEGIQLLQRMGKLSEQRASLEEDLEFLLPFRILDLLSRELNDTRSHQEGIHLLDGFVHKRGGLEGNSKLKKIGGLSQYDFELFFQQIRNFLTVQEQIDLFTNWYRQGSSDSGFLAAIALVASGFSLRRPQNLLEARRLFKGLNYQGLDPMPLIGCVDLLLGDISQAEARFKSSNDEGLRNWLDSYPGEDLAAFCHYCRNWLQNDVLHGYRDIDFCLPDLDGWFADRNVQEYLEALEGKGARGLARAGRSFISSLSLDKGDISHSEEILEQEGDLPMPGGIRDSSGRQVASLGLNGEGLNLRNRLASLLDSVESLRWKVSSLELPQLISKPSENPWVTSAAVFLALFVSGTAIGLIALRIKSTDKLIPEVDSKSTNIELLPSDTNFSKNKDILKARKQVSQAIKDFNTEVEEIESINEINNRDKFEPLSVDSPNNSQIKSLIEEWLLAKSIVLSGQENQDFSKFARPSLSNRVFQDRQEDKASGDRQIINASISSLEILSQTSKRIAVKVQLNYKDQRINAKGEKVSETVIPSLNVRYVIGRDKNIWQLVDYVSGI